MVLACCDSRADPALILQCGPCDLFVVRNVANIVPPYEKDEKRHGTSAALEYAVKVLKLEQLILLGYSQRDGIMTLVHDNNAKPNNLVISHANQAFFKIKLKSLEVAFSLFLMLINDHEGMNSYKKILQYFFCRKALEYYVFAFKTKIGRIKKPQ